MTVSRDILEDLLPGPVTLVFERKLDLNPELNPFTSLVGIRIPNNAFIREMAKACNEPIALTSANLSATKSSVQIKVS